MDTGLISGIVRILDMDGNTAGTGFVVTGEGLIATCAHVVTSAGSRPGDVVNITFHATGETREARVEPDWWRAPDAEDVAILRLVGSLPKEVEPLPLGSSRASEGHEFSSRGYRLAEHFPEGLAAEGKIQARTSYRSTPYKDYPMLQLLTNQIDEGMSGAPIWDAQSCFVVGIVNFFWETRRHIDAWLACATPSETLHALCPQEIPLHPATTRIQRYPALKDHLVDFTADIEKFTRGFVGREFIFQAVEYFIAHHRCGYFRIVAEAGLGKTAIAAQLVKRHDAIAHFFSASNITRADQCLNNLSVQLIARYDLPYDHLPEVAGQDSRFFTTLLGEAMQRSDEDTPLLIVVDAMDEADPTPPGHNWLHLPERLPKGVYFVLTQRPGSYLIRTQPDTPVDEPFHITWDDPRQQADIAAYLRQQAEQLEIAQMRQSASPTVSVKDFVSGLQKASEGNFMYLWYVLEDIRRGELGFDLSQLSQLPRGLKGYYEQFWAQMEKPPGSREYDAWHQISLPVIAVLGAAREPVTAAQIAAWSNVDFEAVHFALTDRRGWRRFIRHQEQASGETWWVIHRSFADFLEETLKPLGELRKMHSRIADWYLLAWGGLEAGLPGLLSDDMGLDPVQHRDGVSHVVWHLLQADRNNEVHILLRCEHEREDGQVVNLWHEAHRRLEHQDGFLADMDRAWQSAEKEGPAGAGKLVRYALMRSSIGSLAATLSADWLIALVRRGVWTPSQAVIHARNIADPAQRARTLAILAVVLPQLGGRDEGELAAGQAWDSIPGIQDVDDKAIALYTLIPALSDDLLPQAFDLAGRFEKPETRAELLIALGTRMEGQARSDLTQEILATIRQVEPIGETLTTAPWRKITAWTEPTSTTMAQVILHLPREDVANVTFEEVLAEARELSSLLERAAALLQLLPQLPRRLVPEILMEVLSLARESHNDGLSIWALLVALGWLILKEEGWKPVNDECRRTIRHIRAWKSRLLLSVMWTVLLKLSPLTARALVSIRHALGQGDRSYEGKHLSWNLNLRRQFYYHYSRAITVKVSNRIQLLLQLASALPTPAERLAVLDQAVDAAQEIEDAFLRPVLLARLALELPEERRDAILHQAFAAAEQIADACERSQALAILSPIAQATGRVKTIEMALSTAITMEDPYIRAMTLGHLLPYLTEADFSLAFEKARQATQEIGPGEDCYRAEALIQLAKSITDQPERDLLTTEAVELVNVLKDPVDRAELLSRIVAISLPEKRKEYFHSAWQAVSSIEDPSLRAQALVGLSQLSSAEERSSFLASQWQQVLGLDTQVPAPRDSSTVYFSTIRPLISSANDDISLRSEVLSQLPPEMLREIAENPKLIGSEYDQICYADVVDTKLPRFSKRANVWPNLFVKVLPHLSGAKRAVILPAVENRMDQQDINKQVTGKIQLMPFIPQDRRKKALAEAKEYANEIPNVQAYADALSALAEYLQGKERRALLGDALSVTGRVAGSDKSQAALLLYLIPHLPSGSLDQALEIANSFKDNIAHAEVMSELIPLLPEHKQASIAAETMTRVLAIEEHHIRADLLIRLVAFQPDQERERILGEALKAILLINDDDRVHFDWASFSPTALSFNSHFYLSSSLFSRTTYKILSGPPVPIETSAFGRTQISGRFSPAGIKVHFRFALFEKEVREDGRSEIRTFGKIEIGKPPLIALDQPRSELRDVLLTFGTGGIYICGWISPIGRFRYQQYSRSDLLSRVCSLLPSETLGKAVEMITEINSVKGRVEALATLAPYFREAQEMFDRAMGLADSVEDTARRAQCFMYLADRSSGESRMTVQEKALEAAQRIEDPNIRMITLVRLAIGLPPNLQDKAWQSVRASTDEWVRSLRDASLAVVAPLWPQLPQDLSVELLNEVLRTLGHRSRPQLLKGLDALIPAFALEENQEIADQLADAVLDTMRWWL